tara:strand:- start:74 stop:331 length:258 start_codon:yes stop_codon:yes gene_type:complete
MDSKTAIQKQNSAWCNYYGIKLVKPRKPIDRILKNLGNKTVDQHIQDKTCSSCYKYVGVLEMTGDDIREWQISGMCRKCQDHFFG